MKMKRRKSMYILWIVIGIIAFIIIYFVQPLSALKSGFNKNAHELISQTKHEDGVFTKEEIAKLPAPVQRYFSYCGFIGKQKMAYMKAEFKNVDFSTGVNKPTLKIDYTQYNFVDKPNRIAFIDSSMFGIPFQGFDSYKNGIGSMKGVIAKTFTLFDQRGVEMDKGCLVTYLSECLLVPNVALQDFITWEPIDDNHSKATISYYGISVSGIFTFDDDGKMLSFTTDDRAAVSFDGKKQSVRWSAVCSDYYKNDDGIMQPGNLEAVWHYPEGDLIYFKGRGVKMQYK